MNALANRLKYKNNSTYYRVDIYYAGQVDRDEFGAIGTKVVCRLVRASDKEDFQGKAARIAANLGGEVRKKFFDPHYGPRGFTWLAHNEVSIIVVENNC